MNHEARILTVEYSNDGTRHWPPSLRQAEMMMATEAVVVLKIPAAAEKKARAGSTACLMINVEKWR